MNSAEIESTEWDYIVVGAGSAGCVAAMRWPRLSEQISREDKWGLCRG